MEDKWIRISNETPPSGTRCIVTDGDIIIIATYVKEPTNDVVWVFTGLSQAHADSFIVKYWMPLPNLPKKIVTYETDK